MLNEWRKGIAGQSNFSRGVHRFYVPGRDPETMDAPSWGSSPKPGSGRGGGGGGCSDPRCPGAACLDSVLGNRQHLE